jgi:hypothetical protein
MNNPDYPETLYCYLAEYDHRTLSINEPPGEWARYKRKESDILAEYYELDGYSDESCKVFRRTPTYFYAEKNEAGDYFIL